MYEKILSIIDVRDHADTDAYDRYDGYDGFIIKTDQQEIFVGVSNGQSCCESWGIIASEDDLKSFVGGYISGLRVTDVALNERILKEVPSIEDYGGTMFVDLNTTRGVLQFALYNCHNGYYGHTAILRSKQLNEEVTI